MTCADTHKSQLMKDNCTEAVVQEFCKKAPPAPTPAEECLRAEEMYCGNDRHNKTLCIKCIALHATELKNKTCTTEEDEKFCDKPAPPNPTAECYQELKKLCQADRSVHAECVACVDKHVNETKAAHCTYTQVEAFCGPQPNPTPPIHCFADMNTLCAKAKVGGEAACVACIKTNAARLEKDHCTAVSDNPPTPPGACVCARLYPTGCACVCSSSMWLSYLAVRLRASATLVCPSPATFHHYCRRRRKSSATFTHQPHHTLLQPQTAPKSLMLCAVKNITMHHLALHVRMNTKHCSRRMAAPTRRWMNSVTSIPPHPTQNQHLPALEAWKLNAVPIELT